MGGVTVKQPKAVLKLAAVLSCVLLVSGFVAYRAGAFNQLMEPGTQPADLVSDTAVEEKRSEDITPPTRASSEWRYNFTPTRPSIVSEDTPSTIIHGPKSAPVFGPLEGLTPAPKPQAARPPAATPPAP